MAAAPWLCNSLAVSIRSACTTSDFKQKLKTFFIQQIIVLALRAYWRKGGIGDYDENIVLVQLVYTEIFL